MPFYRSLIRWLGALFEPQRVSVLNTFKGEPARKYGLKGSVKMRDKFSSRPLIVYLFLSYTRNLVKRQILAN